MFKVGYVGVIGKPNAGKSSLINKLVGFKVAITTPKPQTTRFNIRGIRTSETSQIVFVDTPGVHLPKNKLGEYMMKGVNIAIQDTDIVIYLVDGTKPVLDEANKKIIYDIASSKKKTILVINKIDDIKKENILRIIEEYNNFIVGLGWNFTEIVPISVYKKDGLDILVKCIEGILPDGEPVFDEEEITDISEKDIAEETIREKALNYLDEEVPHGIIVKIEKMKLRETEQGNRVYDIEADIICKKDSHKPIIIGKNGEMLKRITQASEKDISKMTDTRVNLKLWVKVRKDWEDTDNILSNIKDKIR